MIRIEAPTLEEAYTEASGRLGLSIADIEYEIVQLPSRGFLGIGKKPAVIVAVARRHEGESHPGIALQAPAAEPPAALAVREASPAAESFDFDEKIARYEAELSVRREEHALTERKTVPERLIVDDKSSEAFYHEKLSMAEACDEIARKLTALFSHACFKINPIEVVPYAENIILVRFSGEDSALLIGKDGYRYKALSYMIFNWIHPHYGYFLRLEIAEFLQNQEDAVKKYLEGVIESIRQHGRGQTKVLDGVLVQIALHELRRVFSDKNVVIKTTQDGGRYVSVAPFAKKYEQ